jgi:ribosomal protein L15E
MRGRQEVSAQKVAFELHITHFFELSQDQNHKLLEIIRIDNRS